MVWIYEWVRLVSPPKCLAWRLSIKSLKSIVVNRPLSILLSRLSLSYRFDANTWFRLEGEIHCTVLKLTKHYASCMILISKKFRSKFPPSFRQVFPSFRQVLGNLAKCWVLVEHEDLVYTLCIDRGSTSTPRLNRPRRGRARAAARRRLRHHPLALSPSQLTWQSSESEV